MLTTSLNIENQSPLIRNKQDNILLCQFLPVIDRLIRHAAGEALNQSDYLLWAKMGKHIPLFSDKWKTKAVFWIGDSYRLVKSSMGINNRINQILSTRTTHEDKIHGMMEAVEMALDIASIQMFDVDKVKETRLAGCGLMTAAKAGIAFINFRGCMSLSIA